MLIQQHMLVSILVLTNAVLVNETVSVTNEHTCTYSFCFFFFFLREFVTLYYKIKVLGKNVCVRVFREGSVSQLTEYLHSYNLLTGDQESLFSQREGTRRRQKKGSPDRRCLTHQVFSLARDWSRHVT